MAQLNMKIMIILLSVFVSALPATAQEESSDNETSQEASNANLESNTSSSKSSPAKKSKPKKKSKKSSTKKAKLGYFIEPQLGYHLLGTYNQPKQSSLSADQGSYSGFGLGLGAGMTFNQFQAGLDYIYSQYNLKTDSIDEVRQVANTAIGVLGGYSLNLPIRLQLGYYFSDTLTEIFSVGNDELNGTTTGSMIRIGATGKIKAFSSKRLPFIGISLDYFMHSFKTFKLEGRSDISFSPPTTMNSFYLSVGLPIAF